MRTSPATWELNKYKVHQIDTSVKKRDSKWILVCSSCQCEREGTYCQAWNIIKEKSSGICMKCIPRDYFVRPEAWNKGKSGYKRSSIKKNKTFDYLRLFSPESLEPTQESRLKQRNAKLGVYGEKANRWLGGKVSERLIEMSRDAYKQLRKDVFFRDNYSCQMCLVRGGSLEMDHVKEWRNYPELRYESTNCRTLCKACHKTTNNYGRKAIKKTVL